MKTNFFTLILAFALAACLLTGFGLVGCGKKPAGSTPVAGLPSYDDAIAKARKYLDEGKLEEAYLTAAGAVTLDEKRWEAYALMALIMDAKGNAADAIDYLQKARQHAPKDKRDALFEMTRKMVLKGTPYSEEPAMTAGKPVDTRLKEDAIRLILAEADQSRDSKSRVNLLREFMKRSAEVLDLQPNITNLWVLRAAVSVELDYVGSGWCAGNKLKEFGLEKSDSPEIRKVLLQLERHGWLESTFPAKTWRISLEEIQNKALDGDEDAQVAIAMNFFNGSNGLEKDLRKAFEWHRRAAELGSGLAANNVAAYYESQQDFVTSTRWLQIAAERGIPFAMSSYALTLKLGQGVQQHYGQAAAWFKKAAELGDARGQYELGHLYDAGLGVRKREVEAIKWYRLAAEQNYKPALNPLAWHLATSVDNQIRNGNEAVRLATIACESGEFKDPVVIDTLAAAYAESGNSAKAVETQRLAINRLTTDDAQKRKDYESRLRLYEQGKPYHEP